MKKLFKAVACVAVGCSLLSISAFAALTGSVTANQDGTYGVRVSNLGDGESTILVYKSATEINALPASIDESDIVYINQQTAASGNASYTVNVGSRAQAGDKIYFFAGGTNDSAAVLLGSETIPVPATGVTLSANALTFTVGDAAQTLTATVAPENSTDTVVWTSSNTEVATVEGGVVTAVAAGTATITATAGSATATCEVTVSNPVIAVTGVTLSANALTFTVGDAAQTLTATVAPADATDKTVTWSSSNTEVATVEGGVVTAVAAGTATITVTTTDGSFTANCTVTVSNPVIAVSSVTLNKSEAALTVGGTETLTATVAPENATDTVVWTSSNTEVATVADGVVTAVAKGTATITATAGGQSDTCTVTVNAAAPSLPLGTAIAVRNANPYGMTGYSVVTVTGIASGSVKVKDSDDVEVEAYLADYSEVTGGACRYIAIVKGSEFTTNSIIYNEKGTATEIKFGNSNLDGENIVALADAVMTMKLANGALAFSSNMQYIVADPTGDGLVTLADAVTTMKLANGAISVPAAALAAVED